MRALKISFLFLMLVTIVGTSAHAQYNASNVSHSTNAKYPVYQATPRVSHNSKDEIYSRSDYMSREERIMINTGNAPARQVQAPAQQGEKTALRPGYNKPRDGSMFGGTCTTGKCKDGSMFGGSCTIPKTKCMRACKQKCGTPMKKSCEDSCKPCFKCPNMTEIVEVEEVEKAVYLQNYVVKKQDEIYDAIHKCDNLAPIDLKHVDFKIKNNKEFAGFSNKLGNYRFRIFGCRRFDKHTMLNQGRIIQKDLQFVRIFEDITSDCLTIIKTPDDLCDPNNTKPIPEYVLTAEINEYFMNVCDKYNWDEARKENLRTGSSEMTVTWRLTNVTGTELLWEGETIGYAEIDEGEYNGEIVLLERAFADASNSLQQLPDFKKQLSKRVNKDELAKQRQELIELEKIANPIKCQFQEEIKIVEKEKECGIKRICYDIDTCKESVIDIKETTTVRKEKIEEIAVGEDSGSKSTGSKVDEDGGSESTASITTKKETKEVIEIDEKGGTDTSSSGVIEETIKTTTTEIIEIDENSGSQSSGSGALDEVTRNKLKELIEIDENSGSQSSGSGALDETTRVKIIELLEIDENSGVLSSGSGGLNETTREKIIELLEIDENSGALSSGSGALDDATRSRLIEILEIDEASGILSSGVNDQGGALSAGAAGLDEITNVTRIDETSGVSSAGAGNLDETITFEVVDGDGGSKSSGIDEASGSLSAGAFSDELWIDLPNNDLAYTGEIGNALANDELCIVDREPYKTLSAENVYKMRSSVVNVSNVDGKKGSGLIISEYFVLTSADLITKDNNSYDIETINEIKLKAKAIRINPSKNIALLMLEEKTRYNPLPLNLYLPQTGRDGYLTLGMLNKENIKGRLEDKARVTGYRFSDDVGPEIIVNTDVQKTTVGGALIDSYGTISGISHTERGTGDGNDLFLPITSALKGVGLSICGKEFPDQTPTPWYERSTTKTISKAIDEYKKPKAPEKMKKKDRK